MMEYFAHSPKDGFPAQLYSEHIQNVIELAKEYAQAAAQYGKEDGKALVELVELAAFWHDLGKLDKENQNVLSGRKKASRLPRKHWDAGAAILGDINLWTAAVVYSHHTGYPDFTSESIRDEGTFRVKEELQNTYKSLGDFRKIHKLLLGDLKNGYQNAISTGDKSVFLRLLLSCLADADHTDTARHYGKYSVKENPIELRPQERLKALNQYVAELSAKAENTDERVALRNEMYAACRDVKVEASIASNAGPVGTGKTTAIMANQLAQALKRDLRRIFIVLPFTNIIQQSVEVYRKALVLPGENPADVVAELHHRADFESEDARHLTALWRAPIIVTTAVAFFETFASNTPSALRRLHELPGSTVFVDESHAALPAKLLPIAWKWIKILAEEWGCYWVLASGSLCRFWEIKEISRGNVYHVPELVTEDLRIRLGRYERARINYCANLIPQTTDLMIDWIKTFPGPRLVVVNTVQTAAVLAKVFAAHFGQDNTEHLSTALTPVDREKTLERVKKRLRDSSDSDWVLFATSCVEAGVDLSFRTGFRELSSLASLLQTAGRINREGKYDSAKMWTFVLADKGDTNTNPKMKEAAAVLREFFMRNIEITPDLCTIAIEEELKLHGVNSKYQELLDDENLCNFIVVENKFKVIDTDTRIALVSADFAQGICRGVVDWRALQRNSVQMRKDILDKFKVRQILDNVYYWELGYDDFLGYMSGVLSDPEDYIM
jgi:CRISPR-associated endonuclease/helicase Cas3